MMSAKRKHNPLEMEAHEKRYSKKSQQKLCYLEGSQALRVPSSPERRKRSKIAEEKISAYWSKFKSPEEIAVPVKNSCPC